AAAVGFDMLELKLPGDVLADRVACRQLLADVRQVVSQSEVEVFFEVPTADPEGLAGVVAELGRANLPWGGGLKVRCGGPEASAFPPSEQLAHALLTCVRRGVPFKATAGLHHPFPRFDPTTQARMHGFVNLFAAGVLASVRELEAEVVRAVLDDD